MSRQVTFDAFGAGEDLPILTDCQREVWAIYHQKGGIRPAARALNLNLGTVHQHISRAEAKLGVQADG